MKKPVTVESASALIDERIKELGDWRGKTLARVRDIIHETDPGIVEEWKWMGTPVWSHGGLVCTGETYRTSSGGIFRARVEGRRALQLQPRRECQARDRHPGRREDR